MKRVKYSDIRFKVNPKLVYVKNFTMRFYTISSRYYFFEKTEQDVVEVEREATVDDVDVILSGGTKVTEYYIPIEWDELLNVGEGVLNYRLTNNIEDPEFPDHYFNKEITVTTDFYIDCDIHVDPEPAEGLIERIVALEEHLATEIVDRETADSFISGAVDTEIARAISAETELSEALTSETSRAISAETVLDEKIDAETNRATSAETVLREAINSEVERATNAEENLDEKVDQEIADRIADVNAEEARAISAETVLQEALDAEETRASGEEQRIENKLDQEIADRIADVNAEETRATNAETALNAKIDAETNRATSAETALNEALQAESNRAISAETALDAKIDQEIQDRKDDVDAEETRAINAESALTDTINAETNRAISAETELSNAITNETNRATSAETALNEALTDEVNRATSAETTLDEKIVAETNRAISAETALNEALQAETNRATSAETALNDKIDQEIADRVADVNAEETRATAAETALDSKITSVSGAVSTEVARAISAETALQTEIDELSSGSSAAIDAEIARATSAETQLGNRIDSEASARTDADTALSNKIDSLSGTVDTKLADKADKVDAVASAEYVSSAKTINFKNISGTVISTVDATDFIKDGMVDDVKIENGYLVITFNTDAGKESISIALTDIFNPNNYYTKTEIDNTVSGINTSIANEVSARTDADTAINGKIDVVSGNVISETSRATTAENALSGAIDSVSAITSGDVETLTQAIANEVSRATSAENVLSGAIDSISAATSGSVEELDSKITSVSGAVSTEVARAISAETAISGAVDTKLAINDFNTYSGNVDTAINSKASQSTVDALNGVVTAHTADTSIHFTTGTVQTLIDESISGKVDADFDNSLGFDINDDLGVYAEGNSEDIVFNTASSKVKEYTFPSVYTNGSNNIYKVGYNNTVSLELNQSFSGTVSATQAIGVKYLDTNDELKECWWDYNNNAFTINSDYSANNSVRLTYSSSIHKITLSRQYTSFKTIITIMVGGDYYIASSSNPTEADCYISYIKIYTSVKKLQSVLNEKQRQLTAGDGIKLDYYGNISANIKVTGDTHTNVLNSESATTYLVLDGIKSVDMWLNQSYTGTPSGWYTISVLNLDYAYDYYLYQNNAFTFAGGSAGSTLNYDSSTGKVSITCPSGISSINNRFNFAPADDLTNADCFIGLVSYTSNEYPLQKVIDNLLDYINTLKNNNIDKLTAEYDSETDTWYLGGGEY